MDRQGEADMHISVTFRYLTKVQWEVIKCNPNSKTKFQRLADR
jgi:hypothetical protein